MAIVNNELHGNITERSAHARVEAERSYCSIFYLHFAIRFLSVAKPAANMVS